MLTVGCVVDPLASRINQQNLRGQVPLIPVSEVVAVVMIVRSNRPPREFPVVATVMQRGRPSGSGNDGEIRLVDGPLPPTGSDKDRFGFGFLLY